MSEDVTETLLIQLQDMRREIDRLSDRTLIFHGRYHRLDCQVNEAIDTITGLYDGEPFIQALRITGADAVVIDAAKQAVDRR